MKIECKTIAEAKEYINKNKVYPDIVIINGTNHYKTEEYIKINDRISYYYESCLNEPITNNDITIRKIKINL